MKTRMIACWWTDPFDKSFLNLQDDLDSEFCAYLYSYGQKENPEFESLYTEQNLDYYTNTSGQNPLDSCFLEKMATYEQRAMDIIWRWRRSYTTDESYANVKYIYYTLLAYWYDYIKMNKINLLLINIPHIPSIYICYAICKCLNIPVIILDGFCYIKGEKINKFLHSGIDEMDLGFEKRYEDAYIELEKTKNIKIDGKVEKYFDVYNKQNNKIKRVISYSQKKISSLMLQLIKTRIKFYLERGDYKIIFNKAKYLSLINMREKCLRKYVEKLEVDLNNNDSFFFFPLHIQPEATTLPLGGYFSDQLLVIKMMASVLPENCYLYVKEHPAYWSRMTNFESMTECRSKYFYNQINDLPNVKLIKHTYNSLDLVDRCLGVVAITGTIGFEAIFKHKQVLVFGNAYYKDFKFIYNIVDNADCQRAVEEIVDRNGYSYTDDDIRAYLKAIEKYMVTIGSDDQASMENGIEKISMQDMIDLEEKIVEFYRDNYAEMRNNHA